MVEPVISSRVTWWDYSIEKKKKKKEKTFPHEQNNEGFEWLNRAWHLLPFYTSLSGPFVAGNFAATILERFAFKRIGISMTQEQQQMPAYVHAPVHWKNRNAWSWGSNFNSNIQRMPITINFANPGVLFRKILLYTSKCVRIAMGASRMAVLTFLTTAFYLSKQCVNLWLGTQAEDHL